MKLSELDKLLEDNRLVLASGSPRRVKILQDNGFEFRQIIPDVNEEEFTHENPFELAAMLAVKKAGAITDLLEKDEIALAGDTIVLLQGEILGKPASFEEAVKMLSKLSGRNHTVCSALALMTAKGKVVSGYELTEVYFKDHDKTRLEEYAASGEPLDKAGAYGIQGLGGFLVDRIEGNLDNVIGLPMALLGRLAGQLTRDKD